MATAEQPPARCNQCKQVFKNIAKCAQHGARDGHTHTPAYFCSDCDKTFGLKAARAEHIKSTGHLNLNLARPGTTSDSSNATVAAVSANGSGSSQPSKNLCSDCVPIRQFKDAAALANHRQAVHNPAMPVQVLNSNPQRATPMPPPKFIVSRNSAGQTTIITNSSAHHWHCTKCSLDFATEQELQRHYSQSKHHPQCKVCGQGFSEMVSWVQHKARCPPPGYTEQNMSRDTTSTPSAPHAASGASSTAAHSVRSAATVSVTNGSDKGKARATDSWNAANGVASGLPGPMYSPLSTALRGASRSSATTSPTGPTSPLPSIIRTASRRPSQADCESVSNAPQSATPAQLASPRPVHEQQADRVYRTPQEDSVVASLSRSDHSTSPEHPRSGTPRSASPAPSRHANGDIPPPSLWHTGPAEQKQKQQEQYSQHPPSAGAAATPTQDLRPSANPNLNGATKAVPHLSTKAQAQRDAAGLSFRCRSCRESPVHPVTTICGHLFCHSCIVDEIARNMCCPVCQKTFMVRLHVEL